MVLGLASLCGWSRGSGSGTTRVSSPRSSARRRAAELRTWEIQGRYRERREAQGRRVAHLGDTGEI